MAHLPAFGHREAIKTLKHLGFIIDSSSGKGSHVKAIHPEKSPPHQSIQRPFLIIPHRKTFGTRARKEFIKEVAAFGFSKDDIIATLRGKKR